MVIFVSLTPKYNALRNINQTVFDNCLISSLCNNFKNTFRKKSFEQWMLTSVHGHRDVSGQEVVVFLYEAGNVVRHCSSKVS